MITRLQSTLVFVVISSLFFVGCGSDGIGSGPGGGACTTEARSSVTVKVVDGSGAPVTDATVTFSVDGAPAQACESFPDGSYACGFEVDGQFIIGVSKGADNKLEMVTVGMTPDGCHVDGKTITVTLGA